MPFPLIAIAVAVGARVAVSVGSRMIARAAAKRAAQRAAQNAAKPAKPPARPNSATRKADEEGQKTAPRNDCSGQCKPKPDDSLNPQKVDHIFDGKQLAKHKLQDYLNSFGGDKASAFRALQQAAQQKVGSTSGPFETVVNSNGFNVTVRGAVINGTTRISTAFIP